jgi:hypothetical protein
VTRRRRPQPTPGYLCKATLRSQTGAPGVRYGALGGVRRGRLLDDASAASACPREQAVDSFDGVGLRFSALLAMEQSQAGHGSIIGIVVRLLEPAASRHRGV